MAAAERSLSEGDASLVAAVRKLEELTSADPGARGIAPLCIAGELWRVARGLFSARSVAVLTGFPILLAEQPPRFATETDGPPGALAVVRVLCALGKRVLVIVPPLYERVMSVALREGGLEPANLLRVFPSRQLGRDTEFVDQLLGTDAAHPQVDALFSIELSGPASDGRCYSMRALDVTEGTSNMHLLFQRASSFAPKIATFSVGDGGNEMGMGKVVDLVRKHVNHGDKIACVVPADALITAGVSNWGGYAVSFALYLLFRNQQPLAPSSDAAVARLHAVLPTADFELRVWKQIVAVGCVDGVTRGTAKFCDGLDFDVHASLISSLRTVVDSHPTRT
jgi:hypothetical protein